MINALNIDDRYQAGINYLQRLELDEPVAAIPGADIRAATELLRAQKIPPYWFCRIYGISNVWQADTSRESSSASYLTKDILAGLNSQKIRLNYLIYGEPNRVRVYLFTTADNRESGATIRATLKSHYPGLKLWPERELSDVKSPDVRAILESQMEGAIEKEVRPFLAGCNCMGIITGIPTPNVGEQNGLGIGTQVDRLIRGLYGSSWALLVMAFPSSEKDVANMQLDILKQRVAIAQSEDTRPEIQKIGSSYAIYYDQLLQMQNQILEMCQFEGGWWVQSYIGSPDQATYQYAKGLVKSIFSGEHSRVDRIRVLDCDGSAALFSHFYPIVKQRASINVTGAQAVGNKTYKYHTLVSSGELSALIHLPRVEAPGFFVQDSAGFDVYSHVPSDEDRCLSVGEIRDRGRATNNPYRVPVKELTRHGLVVGITGSGKTNTTFHLLQQLQELDPPVNFLVIEPAKREYRRLTRLMKKGREPVVFTIGREGSDAAPFRINPFEIRDNVPVQTHIDLLKSVFNSSFGMWTPLPQVLERALHEVYHDKGWNPIGRMNDRILGGQSGKDDAPPRAHPSLTDLYLKIGELVPRLGYNEEVTRNVKTALETRINGLRIGAKGLMLDTHTSIPVRDLLKQPVVLELEDVGDDDDKAFIIGLILVTLYEYYRYASRPRDELCHVTVFEEAHRLLTNVPPNTDPEAGNARGKAVETFVNMLSEVRAFGEGFLIAEQIPTKLAPDVIKNTSLKIMHRIVSTDDREVMGGAMNLDAQQMRQVVSLKKGEAVVHGGGDFGDDNAILVQVPPAKGDDRSDPTDAEIHARWEAFRKGLKPIYLTYPTCQSACKSVNPSCIDALTLAENPELEQVFASFLLSFLCAPATPDKEKLALTLKGLYQPVEQAIRKQISGRAEEAQKVHCAIVHSLYRYMDQRGWQYQWSYEDTQKMVNDLLGGLLATVENRQLTDGDAARLISFRNEYIKHCFRKFYPFYGCQRVCPWGAPTPLCIFRYNARPILDNTEFDAEYRKRLTDEAALIELARSYTKRVLQLDRDAKEYRSAALCILVQKLIRDERLNIVDRHNFIDAVIDRNEKEQASG